jgi:hypothetical protein
VQDWETIQKLNEEAPRLSRAEVLNGLAYARALGNRDVEQGLKEVHEALNSFGENAAMLDTRGFLYYLHGDLKRALADLDKAVDLVEADYALNRKVIAEHHDRLVDLRVAQAEFQNLAANVAVIRYHRALLREKLGDRAGAEADRRRVKKLGYEPGERLF